MSAKASRWPQALPRGISVVAFPKAFGWTLALSGGYCCLLFLWCFRSSLTLTRSFYVVDSIFRRPLDGC